MVKKAINKKELEELYVNLDMTDKEIAEKLGLSQSHISYLRKQYGIKAIRKNKKVALSKIAFEKLYFDKDFSEEEIARQYNLSKTYVAKLRRNYGIKAKRIIPKNITKEEIIEMYLNLGMSDKQIAGIKGLTRSHITKLRKEYGIRAREHIKKEFIDVNIRSYMNSLLYKNQLTFKEEMNKYFHYKINEKEVKIISTNNFQKSEFKFKLTFPLYENFKERKDRKQIGENKYRINYKEQSDYVILIGLIYNQPLEFWVFSSKELDDIQKNNSHITLGRNGNKYSYQYMNLERFKNKT